MTVAQTIVTSGCLQIIFANSTKFPGSSEFDDTQIYVECLDIFLILEGEISLKVFNNKKNLSAGDLFFCTQSTYAELSHVSDSFSYVRLCFIKDRIPDANIEKRFAASVLDYGSIKRKIYNHCLLYISLFDQQSYVMPEVDARVIHQENLVSVVGGFGSVGCLI